ncbi:hypothetical protein F66182_933 [Fusarium sp. NRRL 66182]|nr:hypothetical protein F66182_933 [Fusarium sp. NRRL 66182]
MRTSLTLSLAALAPFLADAQRSQADYTTETVFLPSRSTGRASNIYAYLITETGSKTEYLLACQTNFDASYTCDGEFTGVTVTYESTDVNVAFGSTSYDCEVGTDEAVCVTKTRSAREEATTTLDASESSEWMTAITIVDHRKRATKASSAEPAETSNSRLCKRKNRDSGGSDSDSDSSSSGSSSSSSRKGGSDSDSDDNCSAGSVLSWHWSILVFGFAVIFL